MDGLQTGSLADDARYAEFLKALQRIPECWCFICVALASGTIHVDMDCCIKSREPGSRYRYIEETCKVNEITILFIARYPGPLTLKKLMPK
jgi:hypothetical protein